MPTSLPISPIAESHKPRCPIASLSVSAAKAALEASRHASAQMSHLAIRMVLLPPLDPPPRVLPIEIAQTPLEDLARLLARQRVGEFDHARHFIVGDTLF